MARVKSMLVRLGIVYADGAYDYVSMAEACHSMNGARLMVVKCTDAGFKAPPQQGR